LHSTKKKKSVNAVQLMIALWVPKILIFFFSHTNWVRLNHLKIEGKKHLKSESQIEAYHRIFLFQLFSRIKMGKEKTELLFFPLKKKIGCCLCKNSNETLLKI
jgi:hypothetical protein